MTVVGGDDPAARGSGARRVVVMVGAPGAGKGTQAERLAEALGLPHVSTGELFRAISMNDSELGRKVRQLLAAVALTVGTTIIVNLGRAVYAWVTFLPLCFVATTTLIAGFQSVRAPKSPVCATKPTTIIASTAITTAPTAPAGRASLGSSHANTTSTTKSVKRT